MTTQGVVRIFSQNSPVVSGRYGESCGAFGSPVLSHTEKEAFQQLSVHFSLVTEEEGRERLVSYLAGDDATLLSNHHEADQEGVERGLRYSLQDYVSERFLPLFFETESERIDWIERCLRGIVVARERMARGGLVGTEDKFVNALVGPVLQGILAPGFSQEAVLRTPEKERGERLERWRRVGGSFFNVKFSPEERLADKLVVSVSQVPPLEIANFSIQSAVAHAMGDRRTQEDGDLWGTARVYGQEIGYFAIIDGHAGCAVTTFLQKTFATILTEHLEIAGKPLQDMNGAEIENLLTSLFVKVQFRWNAIHPEWARECFVAEMDAVIESIFNKAGEGYIDTQIPTVFKLILDKIHVRLCSLEKAKTDEEKSKQVSEYVNAVVDEFCQQLDLQAFQKGLFGKELQDDIVKRLKKILTNARKKVGKVCANRHDDPGAVISLALIAEELGGVALYAVNVGDSRILAFQGQKVYPMTEDASSQDDRFEKGIIKRGGKIVTLSGEKRVWGKAGSLNVARSVGDEGIQGMTARAKVQRMVLDQPTTVVIGCDGLFERRSSHDLGEKFLEMQSQPVSERAEGLVRWAYASGSSDNMSAMVMVIRPLQ